MGEYARFRGAEIKIGTCESMYYLRADQRHLIDGYSFAVLCRQREGRMFRKMASHRASNRADVELAPEQDAQQFVGVAAACDVFTNPCGPALVETFHVDREL